MPYTRITDPETRFLCIATAAFNLEGIVAGELKRLGLTDARGEQGAVRFHATLAEAYLACLRLRSADRVMLVLAEGECRTFEELFQLTRTVDWAAYLTRDAQINVSGKCARSQLMSVSDCQAICKKAILTTLTQTRGQRVFPETGAAYPIHVSIHCDHTRICLDLCGSGLNRRGYRTWNGEAPLRETLAASLVELSPWRPGQPLYDPCCGTGTLLIEAAFRAGHRAPGMERSFACETFGFFSGVDCEGIRSRVRGEFEPERIGLIAGSDIDPEACSLAQKHIRQAGLQSRIEVTCADLNTLQLDEPTGVFLCNPPYGERMSDQKTCRALYAALGRLQKRHPGWALCAITSDHGFEAAFGRRASKRNRLYNGRLECQFLTYEPIRGRKKRS